MKTRVVLTIDTEPSVGGVFQAPDTRRPLIDEPVAGMVNGRSEGLGFILDTLARHALPATFFVETVHTRALPEAAMGRYVDQILAGGHDVQLHFHPVWLSWRDHRLAIERKPTDDSASLSRAELADVLRAGMDQIRRWTGTSPSAARAGNFSTALSVLQASADAGLHQTSHICLALKPPPEPELALAGGVHDIAGVRELPVTCFHDRGAGGGLRPLQINAVSSAEMRQVLGAMQAAAAPVAVIVMHPFDFVKRADKQFTAMRPNRLVQRRLAALCAFLDRERDRFETVPLGSAAQASSATAATRLSNSRISGTLRAAANYLDDRYA